MGDLPWLKDSKVLWLQCPMVPGSRDTRVPFCFMVILGKGKASPFSELPGHVSRRNCAAETHHLVKIQTEYLTFWSCHSTESHSHKQQGPRGFDGNTNTTCDSIKEALIKKGEQRAVSPIISSHWGLAHWL